MAVNIALNGYRTTPLILHKIKYRRMLQQVRLQIQDGTHMQAKKIILNDPSFSIPFEMYLADFMRLTPVSFPDPLDAISAVPSAKIFIFFIRCIHRPAVPTTNCNIHLFRCFPRLCHL
jgi:hypothetical protein